MKIDFMDLFYKGITNDLMFGLDYENIASLLGEPMKMEWLDSNCKKPAIIKYELSGYNLELSFDKSNHHFYKILVYPEITASNTQELTFCSDTIFSYLILDSIDGVVATALSFDFGLLLSENPQEIKFFQQNAHSFIELTYYKKNKNRLQQIVVERVKLTI